MANKAVILVAEDNEDDVFLMTRALQMSSIAATPHFVADGQFAVDYLSGVGKYADRTTYPLPHLAFFDINMPRRSGLEALEWVRQESAIKTLPVAIVTSSGLDRDKKRAQCLGATAYVVKPVSTADLAREVKEFYTQWIGNEHPSQAPMKPGPSPQP